MLVSDCNQAGGWDMWVQSKVGGWSQKLFLGLCKMSWGELMVARLWTPKSKPLFLNTWPLFVALALPPTSPSSPPRSHFSGLLLLSNPL